MDMAKRFMLPKDFVKQRAEQGVTAGEDLHGLDGGTASKLVRQ
jgi:hypothetical protein